MTRPTYLPALDTNGTRQPTDPAGIPSPTKTDGFREIDIVPNTWWNWLGKTVHDWINFLDGSRVYDVSGGESVISAAGELAVCSATVPANTLEASKSRIYMSGAFEITAVPASTLFTMRLRVGDTNAIIASFATATLNVGAIYRMDAEAVLMAAGALHYVVNITEVVDKGASLAVGSHQMTAGTTTIDPTLQGIYQITAEWTGGAGSDIVVSRGQVVRVDRM